MMVGFYALGVTQKKSIDGYLYKEFIFLFGFKFSKEALPQVEEAARFFYCCVLKHFNIYILFLL
jgi:hypothetical protein